MPQGTEVRVGIKKDTQAMAILWQESQIIDAINEQREICCDDVTQVTFVS